MIINIGDGDLINQVSVKSELFFLQIAFTTNKKIIAGQKPDDDSKKNITLVNPFSINSLRVVSDVAEFLQSSGNQMCGIAISAI